MGITTGVRSARFSRALPAALIAGTILLSVNAPAQTDAWNQTSGAANWSTAGDWTASGGATAPPNAAGVTATINTALTAAETITVTSDTVGALNVGASSGGSKYTILGGTLTLNSGDSTAGAGAAITELSTANGDTISSGIVMADAATTTALTITNNSGNSLTLSGGITGSGNLLLAPTAAGGINATTGGGINNSGTVTFTSSGVSTYSSITVGSNVTQVLDNSNNSSTLQISPLAVNSNGTTLVYSATGGSAALNVTGAVTGSGNLIFDNTTSTGAKFTDSNTINLSGGVINNSSGTGAIVLSGVIGGTVAATTVTQNSGALTLDAANLYTGTTSVNGGTLLLDFSQTGAPTTNIINSGNSIVMGGGTFSIKGNNATTTNNNSQTLVMTQTASTGLSSLVVNDNTATAKGSGTTTLALGSGGLGTRGAGDTMNIDLSQGLNNNAAGDVITTTATASTLGWATVKDATDTGFATYTGTTVVRLTGQATLAAGSNSSSTDFITTPTSSSTTGSPYLTLTASTNPSWDTLTIKNATGANFLDLGGNTVTLTQNALLMTSSSNKAFTIQNGQVGAANSEVIVQQMGTGTLTIGGGTNGATISSGTGILTKSGAGTLILTSANTYSGVTNINQGTLQLGTGTSGSVINSTAGVTVNSGGTLLFGSSAAISNTSTALSTSGTGIARISFASSLTDATETMGALTLNAGTTIIDFGSSTAGNTLKFSGLTLSGSAVVDVFDWNGDPTDETGTDSGSTSDNYDRLLFSSSVNSQDLADINFYSGSSTSSTFLGTGAQIEFTNGGSYQNEVAVPEPSTVFAAVCLLGLTGWRGRRRLQELVGRSIVAFQRP